jgi:hypothetical protein
MTAPTWQKYPTGVPRGPEALARLARHRAAKLGYRLHRSRKRRDPNNAGGFVLVDQASTIVLGAGFTASIEIILEFIEQEQAQPNRSPPAPAQARTRLDVIEHMQPQEMIDEISASLIGSINSERLARNRAAKLGYRIHRSRKPKSPTNAGGFVLVDRASAIVLGGGYTATIEEVLEFIERERTQLKQQH